MNESIYVFMDIDPIQCVFCGVCQVFCPFGAIKLYIDGKTANPVLESKAFPEVLRIFEIDEGTCKRVSLLCERLCTTSCPLSILYFDESCVQINDLYKCPTCRKCEAVCQSVIHVEKIFNGSIKIHNGKCLPECKNCIDACPVNALYLDKDGKVNVLDDFCIFCGACKNTCPEDKAINIKITHVTASSTESIAWKAAVEKLSLYRPSQKKMNISGLRTSWPKVTKTDNQKELIIERKAYLRSYILELNKDLCKKCQICYLVCPKGAVNIRRTNIN